MSSASGQSLNPAGVIGCHPRFYQWGNAYPVGSPELGLTAGGHSGDCLYLSSPLPFCGSTGLCGLRTAGELDVLEAAPV
ncbi:hypothetical protein ETAA8_31280 [Anatilimnocola aggregata]|uniref:Uncharacterized protein n=1 Tax=Anatilimnocola aggregata TaxID=2528021 RepID=A0A517YCR7_9BACT|nr:hypothetical protein [Anatilimnocola aggregata]QDU28036.1 hypothetical protein ETAA8_31280 [Anatilimnocola aggregata]